MSTRGTGASSLSYEPCEIKQVSGGHGQPFIGLDTHLLEGIGGLRWRMREGKLEPVVAGVDDIKRLVIRKVGGIIQQQLGLGHLDRGVDGVVGLDETRSGDGERVQPRVGVAHGQGVRSDLQRAGDLPRRDPRRGSTAIGREIERGYTGDVGTTVTGTSRCTEPRGGRGGRDDVVTGRDELRLHVHVVGRSECGSEGNESTRSRVRHGVRSESKRSQWSVALSDLSQDLLSVGITDDSQLETETRRQDLGSRRGDQQSSLNTGICQSVTLSVDITSRSVRLLVDEHGRAEVDPGQVGGDGTPIVVASSAVGKRDQGERARLDIVQTDVLQRLLTERQGRVLSREVDVIDRSDAEDVHPGPRGFRVKRPRIPSVPGRGHDRYPTGSDPSSDHAQHGTGPRARLPQREVDDIVPVGERVLHGLGDDIVGRSAITTEHSVGVDGSARGDPRDVVTVGKLSADDPADERPVARTIQRVVIRSQTVHTVELVSHIVPTPGYQASGSETSTQGRVGIKHSAIDDGDLDALTGVTLGMNPVDTGQGQEAVAIRYHRLRLRSIVQNGRRRGRSSRSRAGHSGRRGRVLVVLATFEHDVLESPFRTRPSEVLYVPFGVVPGLLVFTPGRGKG